MKEKKMTNNKTQFECLVTETSYSFKHDNKRHIIEESWLISANSLDELYELMAEEKLKEIPEPEDSEDFTSIRFCNMRKVEILEDISFDLNVFKNTNNWKDGKSEENHSRIEMLMNTFGRY